LALYQSGEFDKLGGADTFARAVNQSRSQMDDALAGMGQMKEELTALNQLGMGFGMTTSSAFEDAVLNGAEFKDVLDGIAKDILRMVLRLAVTNQIVNAFGGAFGGPDYQPLPTLGTYADGGRIMAGVPGGIYNSPVVFPMPHGARKFAKGGIGILGEAGPEAIVPLPDGKSIPVQLEGGGNSMEVHIHESPGNGGQTRERQGSGGPRILDVFVDRVKSDLIAEVNRGGALSKSMESRYGLNRARGIG
jgi:phage-related minor tail protein